MTRVAIIGGGIGGLAAGRALCRRGIEVQIYEAAPELREIGAGVALGPNAMKVLRSLGLEDDVRAIAGRWEWAVTRNGKTGRTISRTSRQQQATLFGSAGATAHRADLLDVLSRSVPTDIVTLGARCKGVEPYEKVAVARFEDGSEVEADVIVGADGIHSAVRGSLFGPDAPRFTGKICYRSVVPVDAVSGAAPANDNAQWLGPHGTIVLYPVRRDELINVLERYNGWHESLLRAFSAGDVWYKWALYDRDPIAQWTRGRATVLGDAAHPMLPYLGQGACQAIEDGVVLAAALAARADDPVAALALYERSRRPRASQVVLASRERGLSNHLVSPLAAFRRDVSIAVKRRFGRDPDGRGTGWIPEYDASAPEVLAG